MATTRRAVALALAAALLGATGGGVDIVDPGDMYQAIATSSTVSLTAFVLAPGGEMVRALATACRRRARVVVELDRPGFADVRQSNDAAIAQLRSAGCEARYASRALHMKVALLDHVAYLSDKNFAAGGLFVRDSRADDRAIIAQTLEGDPQSSERFWTRKADALDGEAEVMGTAHRMLLVETESFGAGTAVYDALLNAPRSGVHAFLLVASREFATTRDEQAAVGALIRAGVVVRLSGQNAKLAVADGLAAWVGSSNATASVPDQEDWGMRLSSSAQATAIRARFARDWAVSEPV